MTKTVTLERTLKAPLAEVWELWTTKDGIESWWGPEGFSVTVQKLDLRAGGDLLYAMTATRAQEVAFMKEHGMPLTQHVRAKFTEVAPRKVLAYTTLADFIPGTKPYDVGTRIEFAEQKGGTRVLITLDAMHDEVWTERSKMGHESELRKLDALLATRH